MSATLLAELRATRMKANASMRATARELGWSPSRYRRFEAEKGGDPTLRELYVVAAVLGLELSAGMHPVADGLVDRGHQALLKRFRTLLAATIVVTSEAPLMVATMRSWDLLLRIGGQLVGVEAETRVRDAQEFVRRIRIRERDGGADAILIVFSNSRHNRELVHDLREMLGPAFSASPHDLRAALRAGRELPGSGILLL